MNCPWSEHELALYVAGDLDACRNQAISGHIAECDVCRKILTDLQLSQALLLETSAEPSDEDLQALRTAVTNRLRVQPKRTFWWQFAAAAAILASLIPFAFRRDSKEFGPEPEPIAQVQQLPIIRAPALTIPDATVVEHVRHRIHRAAVSAGIRNVVLRSNDAGQSELLLATADPNVVILLPLKGDTHAN